MKKTFFLIIFSIIGVSLLAGVYGINFDTIYSSRWVNYGSLYYRGYIKSVVWGGQFFLSEESPALWNLYIDSLNIKKTITRIDIGYFTFNPLHLYQLSYTASGIYAQTSFDDSHGLSGFAIGKRKTSLFGDTIVKPYIASFFSIYRGVLGYSGIYYQYRGSEINNIKNVNNFSLSYNLFSNEYIKGSFYGELQGYMKNDTIKRAALFYSRFNAALFNRKVFPLVQFSYLSPSSISSTGAENNLKSLYLMMTTGYHFNDILYMKPMFSYRNSRGFMTKEYSFYMNVAPPVIPSISSLVRYMEGSTNTIDWSQIVYQVGMQKFIKGWNFTTKWRLFYALENSFSGYTFDTRIKRYFYRNTSAWFYFRKENYEDRSTYDGFNLGLSVSPKKWVIWENELLIGNYTNWFVGFRTFFNFNKDANNLSCEYKYNYAGNKESVFSLSFSRNDTLNPVGLASITGIVYTDINENYRYDENEDYPVEGVFVTLSNGKKVLTDAEGKFKFYYLPMGDYKIKMDAATIPAYLGLYVENEIDVSLRFFTKVDVEFPLAPLGLIEGYVFMDRNRNGVKDIGEEGVSGVVVYIDGTDKATVTDRNGHYILGNLPFATYRVFIRNLPPDTELSLPNLITIIKISHGKEENNVNIGIAPVKKIIEKKTF